MMMRLSSLLVVCLMLSACSSTPDRYAFWRDNSETANIGTAPNLGDVPDAPNVKPQKTEMEVMRDRMEAERQNAFRAADGLPPMPVENVTAPQEHFQEAAPAMIEPAVKAPTSQPILPDNIIINRDAMPQSMNYNYMPRPLASNDDPSILVDLSVIGAGYGRKTPNSPIQSVVFFDHGSASLNAQASNTVRLAALQIKKSGERNVMLVGHASHRTGLSDPIAAQAVNLRMSEKRAESVLQALAHQGITTDSIRLSALGDTAPNTHVPHGKSQEAADRRVEIMFD